MDSRLRSLGILGRLHSVRMPITRGGDNPAAVVRVAGSLAMPACAAALLAAAFLVAAPFAAAGMLDAYVGCSWTDNCYPFDLQTYEIGEAIDVLPEGNYPYDAVMDFRGREIWIPGASGDGVVVIDRASDVVSHRIPVGPYLVGLCFGADGSFALVSSREDNRIYRVSTLTYGPLGFVQLSAHPGNLALDPISGRIYAVEWYGDMLYELSADGTTLLRSAPIGDSLWQLVVDPGGAYVYVTDRGTDQIRVIDTVTLTQVAAVPVGDDPWGLDVTSDGAKLVATCEDSHDAFIIATGSWATTRIPLAADADPRDVDISDSQRLAYVCGGIVGATDPIFVLDLTTDVLSTSFDVTGGSNTNVIAVQPQMHGEPGAIADAPAAESVLCLSVAPHPIAGPARVRYRLTEPGEVRLGIFDPNGRRLALIERGWQDAGEHEACWAAAGPHGRRLPAGTYYLRLDVDGRERAARPLILQPGR